MPKKISYQDLKFRLLELLRFDGPAKATNLRNQLGISQPVFSRLARQCSDELLVMGRGRLTRYAARRAITDVVPCVPIYEIDQQGGSRHLANLHALAPDGFFVEALTDDIANAVHDDLPFLLDPLRPDGFLGRLIPHRHQDMALPSDIRFWTDEHVLRYLTRYGWNMSGNLILGDEAFRLYLGHSTQPQDMVETKARAQVYAQRAEDVLSSGAAGSSAAGEQPKFLAIRAAEKAHVLVKFSPPATDALSRRLADLLVCEHLALSCLRRWGQSAARSDLLIGEGRVFLELQRFDRIGLSGRRGLLSLAALDAQYLGRLINWTDTVSGLVRLKLLEAKAIPQARWLELFGELIANNDMHGGNLSCFTRGTQLLGLAPAYDMLPMQYAPLHGQLIDRPFAPTLPAPGDAALWRPVCVAAADFWTKVSTHAMISPPFQTIARQNADRVKELQSLGDRLPR